MARSRGFFRRKAATSQGEIEPIRIGDMLPVAPEQSAREVADRVRSIVNAAERNAEEIERFAHADAERIRAEAVAEGEAHVARVRASTAAIERRAAALEEAMGEIISGLGRGAAQLDRELTEVSSLPAELETPAAQIAEPAAAEPPPAPDPEPEPEPQLEPDAQPEPGGDEEGARLVALSMAFDGASREDAGAELREHYPGVDVDALLEDIYAEFGDAETSGDPPSS